MRESCGEAELEIIAVGCGRREAQRYVKSGYIGAAHCLNDFAHDFGWCGAFSAAIKARAFAWVLECARELDCQRKKWDEARDASAAKRRKNAAHGASRGHRNESGTSPRGAEEQFSRTFLPAKSCTMLRMTSCRRVRVGLPRFRKSPAPANGASTPDGPLWLLDSTIKPLHPRIP
jgi:hypothetical protein